MKTSEQIDKIAEALATAQSAMTVAAKESTNPAFKSRYADLSSVIEACRPHLSANGISFTQSLEKEGENYIMTTLLMHKSGQYLRFDFPVVMGEMKGNVGQLMQALGSITSYARRYGLMSAVGIAMGDDDDAEGAKTTEPAKAVNNEAAIFQKNLTDLRELVKTKGLVDDVLEFGRVRCKEDGTNGANQLMSWSLNRDVFLSEYKEYINKKQK